MARFPTKFPSPRSRASTAHAAAGVGHIGVEAAAQTRDPDELRVALGNTLPLAPERHAAAPRTLGQQAHEVETIYARRSRARSRARRTTARWIVRSSGAGASSTPRAQRTNPGRGPRHAADSSRSEWQGERRIPRPQHTSRQPACHRQARHGALEQGRVVEHSAPGAFWVRRHQAGADTSPLDQKRVSA